MSRKMKRRAPKPLSVEIVKDNLPILVADKLFMGSMYAAFDKDILLKHNITHIVNVSGAPTAFPDDFTYLTIRLKDKENSNLLSCLPVSNIFIEGALSSPYAGGVLVHCKMGRSRSAAILAAFLMQAQRRSFDEVYAAIRQKRNAADLNIGFESQLRAYGANGYDIYRAHQQLLSARMQDVVGLHRLACKSDGEDSLHDEDRAVSVAMDARVNKQQIDDEFPPLLRGPAFIRMTKPENAAEILPVPRMRGIDHSFVCRRCQTPLFSSSSVLRHEPDEIKRPGGRASETLASEIDKTLVLDAVEGEGQQQQRRRRQRAQRGPPRSFASDSVASTSGDTIDASTSSSGSAENASSTLPLIADHNTPRSLRREQRLVQLRAVGGDYLQSVCSVMHEIDEGVYGKITACEHIFTQPLAWMGVTVGNQQGQIVCPNASCKLVLGSYDWRGSYCSCGARVSPSFKISSGLLFARDSADNNT